MTLTLASQSQCVSYVHWKVFFFWVSSTGFQPMTSVMLVQCSHLQICEATQMRAGQFVGLVFLWKEWVKDSARGTCWDCPASLRIISSIIIYLFIVLCSFLHSPLIFWLCDKLLLKTMTSTINWFSNFLKHILLQFHFEMFIKKTLSNTNIERLRL